MRVNPGDGTEPYLSTLSQVAPEGMLVAWRPIRLIEDWAFSSAGRSGALIGQNWAFQISDTLVPTRGNRTERFMDCIPLWTHTAELEPVEGADRDPTELLEDLQRMDTMTGVPFNWFFYLLHGNLVRDPVGHAIAKAVREQRVHLPPHDARILQAWSDDPYGF